jgi:hypothetical protein
MPSSILGDGQDGRRNQYVHLDQGCAVMAYYIWIDGSGENLRFVELNLSLYVELPNLFELFR